MSSSLHGQGLLVGVAGIGLLGPGLTDWASGQALLRTPSDWAPSPTVLPTPARLPAAERRRAGAIVKLGLAVADQAVAQAGVDPSALATVFSASTGDAANCHAMCETLATAERLVSPTRFTNSVHNASAGYWHIATASMAPSTSLCAHDASFGAGLLEAASQCVATQAPVLLVAGDVPYPEPLRSARPIPDAMAVALVLQPAGAAGALATLSIAGSGEAATPCWHEGLEQLRRQIPAARALPLLRLLADGSDGRVVVEGLDGFALDVTVSLCA
jgi:hypothetical protein